MMPLPRQIQFGGALFLSEPYSFPMILCLMAGEEELIMSLIIVLPIVQLQTQAVQALQETNVSVT